MKLRYAAGTHPGLRRPHNEDCFSLLGEQGLFVVADGMGGHASGEVASQIAVDTLTNFYVETARDPDGTWPFKDDRTRGYDENRLVSGIKLANLRVFEAAQADNRYRGMGTTLVALGSGATGTFIAHVGDSRAYVVAPDGRRIDQLTDDHSLLNDYLKVHKMTAQEIERFPHKNVIVRALGMKDSVAVDVRKVEPRVGETYLLCSDGLSGMLEERQLKELVVKGRDDLEEACDALIAAANAEGGIDNITVVLVHVDG
jgi:serine/threonine protein phosphatase PrpC